MTTRIVALISGTGSLLAALLAEIAEGKLDAQVVAVVSDRPGIAGLEKAAEYGIATQVVALERGADRQAWDRQLTEVVAAYEPDLVASIGFMKLLGTDFLSQFGGRTINSHPSLLPSFPGTHAPRDALEYGVKVTGATVFLVDEGIDTGKILLQGAVPVASSDDVATLHERIKVTERQLLVQAVAEWNEESR